MTVSERDMKTSFRRNVPYPLIIAAVLTVVVELKAAGEPRVGFRRGEMCPDFILPRLDGGTLQLSDFRGKRVVLFHFASW